MAKIIRKASHAGSWYKSGTREIVKELTTWLNHAPVVHSPARAIIAPHAGYSYCGACSAHAYKQIDPSDVKLVFILGPSHHVHLDGCALSTATHYSTPLYDLPIDLEVYKQLYATGYFETLAIDSDEDEHSLEMQLPYIAKVMENQKGKFKIVPIVVGSLSFRKEQIYGQLLAYYLANPNNLFIISSDFCHWGSRFRYTYYDESAGTIWESITKLDRTGMDIIEMMNHKLFNDYLKEFHNTICGRHPIGVLLAALNLLQEEKKISKSSLKFVQYDQSNKCRSLQDSSVSYAAASLTLE